MVLWSSNLGFQVEESNVKVSTNYFLRNFFDIQIQMNNCLN